MRTSSPLARHKHTEAHKNKHKNTDMSFHKNKATQTHTNTQGRWLSVDIMRLFFGKCACSEPPGASRRVDTDRAVSVWLHTFPAQSKRKVRPASPCSSMKSYKWYVGCVLVCLSLPCVCVCVFSSVCVFGRFPSAVVAKCAYHGHSSGSSGSPGRCGRSAANIASEPGTPLSISRAANLAGRLKWLAQYKCSEWFG